MSDNAKLQALLDKKGKVTIPPGVYSIDVKSRLEARADSVITMTGVTLKALPTTDNSYTMLGIKSPNVTLKGGTFIGTPSGPSGHGMGVRIDAGAKNVTIDSVTSTKQGGDGFYIGGGEDVKLYKCMADANRRQGLSIIAVRNLVVDSCTFQNTKGILPGDGIDIEPDKGCVIENVQILKCNLLKNAGNGIEIAGKRGTVKKVTIKGCKYSGNAKAPLKIENIPNADKYQPSMWDQIKAKVLGDYSGYPTTVTIA